jgi:alanyl-tRNA synthetase
MPTDRIYYTDPFCREFDAVVERVDERDGRTVLVVDRTAFYPTSGGQPFDVGTLAGFRVADVIDDDGEGLGHVIEASPSEGRALVGREVRGSIDWTRRFDHMQQHSGQHVLSAVIEGLTRAKTVGFHLGATESTIDLDRELGGRELTAAERSANAVVWDDHPVTIRFVTAEEAAALPLRKPVKENRGTVRLIEIGAVDLSACGGTHVGRTGAIGAIVITAWERFKGGQRVSFLCGGRVLTRFDALRDTVAAGIRLLSVLPDEVPSAIEKMQAEARDQRRLVSAMQSELARHRAAALAASSSAVGSAQVVLAQSDLDAGGLKTMASAIAERPGHLAVLLSATSPFQAVVARAPDVKVAANAVLSHLLTRFGGRGGGRADLAQGGGLSGASDEILAAARDAIAAAGP